MIKFNLDQEVALSSYEQIKGQLLSAIYCGKIKEGDRLPSIREVAEELGVNYKTMRKIYLRLADENYIEIVKGSGAFLRNRSGEGGYEQMRRRAVFKLLGEVENKAVGLGLPAEKFIPLFESYTSGRNLKQLHLAVIDHEEEAFIFSRELTLRLGTKASSISLSQVQSNGASKLLQDCDYFLTTSWHMEEVKPLAEQHGKPVVEIKPSHEIYREILMAAQSRKVAIVIQDEKTMHASQEIFMNLFYPSTEKQFWIAPIHREDLIEKIIQEAELIFVSPMCWDEMRKRTPADKELKTYENFISEETIDHLKELQLLT
jgi:GntR family transcriptional regulator